MSKDDDSRQKYDYKKLKDLDLRQMKQMKKIK